MADFSHHKHFGQHFLHDPVVLQRIVAAIAPQSNDPIIEIGPGLGALTDVLLPRVAAMDAIEIDPRCVAALQDKHDAARLRLHHQDVLNFDFSQTERRWRIVGNLPYNISTPLIFHCLAAAPNVQDMHVMVQKEVAERMVATPHQKTYGRLSVMVQHACDVEILFHVSPRAFQPPPQVMSSVCRLLPKSDVLVGQAQRWFAEIVRVAFMHRRKQLGHTLKRWWTKDALQALGIDPTWRPENLTPEDFVRLTEDRCQRHRSKRA